MNILLVIVIVSNIILYAYSAFKEGVRSIDYLILAINTMLMTLMLHHHKELKCLLENLPK